MPCVNSARDPYIQDCIRGVTKTHKAAKDLKFYLFIYLKFSDNTYMMKYESLKHIAKNMADHSTQNISGHSFEFSLV